MVKINHAGGDVQDQYCSASEFRFYGAKHETEAPAADKAELQKLVDDILAADLAAEDYTEATWKPFELALADAHFHDAAERLPETVAETVFLLKRHIVFKEDVVSDGIGQIPPFPPPLMQMENQIGNGEILQLLISVRCSVRDQKHISPPDRIGPALRHMHSLPRTDNNQLVKIMVVPAVRKLIPVVLRRTADRKGPEIFFRNQEKSFLHKEGILFLD